MKATWYAEALYRALKKGGDEAKIVARFRDLLIARGHGALLHFIPRELERIARREHAHEEVVLVTADETSKKRWIHAYDYYEKEGIIPEGSVRKETIDPSIVGGYQIKTKNILIDASYKKSLISLYRNITNQQ